MKKISITWSAALLLSLLLVPLLLLTNGGVQQASAVTKASPLPPLQHPTPNKDIKKWQDFLRARLAYFSTPVMLRLAENLGVTQIKGRSLVSTKTVSAEQVRTSPNIPVATSPDDNEEEPSIAASPTDPKMVFAFLMDNALGFYGCSVWASDDSGSTWISLGPPPSSPLDPDGATPDKCGDPVVRWSPDGSVAYLSYLSIRTDGTATDDIIMTLLDPATWTFSAPVLVEFGTANTDLWDRPWIDVHQVDPTQAAFVYLTATYFSIALPGPLIVFDGSNGNGAGGTWYGPSTIANWPVPIPGFAPWVPLVQFSRPIGGVGPWVLACWYNSEADGPYGGPFSIRCKSSPNNGVNWNPEVTAARSLFELPYYLTGNSGFGYETWWTSMGPSIAISPDGRAHIVFTRDPTVSQTDSECGDVMYTRTPTAYNYALWSLALPVGALGLSSQGFPTIVVQQRPAVQPTLLGYRLYLFYISTQLSPIGAKANILYDVYMRYSNTGGTVWLGATRITEQSSLSAYWDPGIGDYMDSSATNRRAWVIWTDRADKLDIYDMEDDVFTEFVSAD
jgi:hypothetical protein